MAKSAHGSTVINLPSGETDPTIDTSNATIKGTGSYDLFVGGSNDVVELTGGNETVNAPLGGNTIDTGAGNDTIEISGSNNLVNGGAGHNAITDNGSGNTFVVGGGARGQGDDLLYGQTGGMKPNDLWDLRQLLGLTTWNGSTSTLSEYLKVKTVGANAILMERAMSSDAWHPVLTFEESGSLTLSQVLSQAIV